MSVIRTSATTTTVSRFARAARVLRVSALAISAGLAGARSAHAADAVDVSDAGFSVETAGCSLELGWGSMSKGSIGKKPGAPTLDDASQFPACKVQWDGEELLYICQCAATAAPHFAALKVDEGGERPRPSSICSEKLRSHCGDVRQRVVRECENTQGRCRVRAVGIDGLYPISEVSVNCNCEGARGWSYEERGTKKPEYTLTDLDSICTQELAECPGNSGSGLGDVFDLPKDENFSSSASCRFAEGGCRVQHTPQNTGIIECECDNRFEIRSVEGELFAQPGTDELLDYCDGQMYECQDMLLAGKGPTGDWKVKQRKPGEEEDPSGGDDGDDGDDDDRKGGEKDSGTSDNGDKPDDGDDDAPESDKKKGGVPGSSTGGDEGSCPELDVGSVLDGLGCQMTETAPSFLGLFFAGLCLLRRKKR